MKIIQQGKSKEELNKVEQKTCRDCGCVFEYSREDVKHDRDGSYVICPNKDCNKFISVGSVIL